MIPLPLIGYGALAAVGLLVLHKASQALPAAGAAINPLNPGNVFNTTANQAVSAATGRNETVGGWLYDLTHPDPVTSWKPPPPPVTADPNPPPLIGNTSFQWAI